MLETKARKARRKRTRYVAQIEVYEVLDTGGENEEWNILHTFDLLQGPIASVVMKMSEEIAKKESK